MSEQASAVLPYDSHAAHHDAEPPILFDNLGYPAHHFQDAGQQKEAATLGMWLFLATEVLLFGGMFAGYFVYRNVYHAAWVEGSHHLYWWVGSVNTVVLLASSLSVALAIHAAHQNDSKGIVRWLLATIVFGGLFLVVKGIEYYVDYKEDLIPWIKFEPHGTPEHLVPQVKLFFVFYFIMTMIHASHMIAGLTVMAVLAWYAHKGKYNSKYYTPVEMAGLYWHFVDIVWVFLLPALYLIRA